MSMRRNLLIVLAHGLRSDAIGDSRTWPLLTPHFKKLSTRSLRLVASSVCPADCGGLVSLLTGKHARQHGIDQNDMPQSLNDCWAARLKEAGYHLAGAGLVGPISRWLDQSVTVGPLSQIEPEGCDYLQRMKQKELLRSIQHQRIQRRRAGIFDPERNHLHPDDDIDGFIIVQARQMIASLPQDKPWAMIVVFSGPGNDLAPPAMYSDVADPKLLQTGFQLADLRKLQGMAELDYPKVRLQKLTPGQLGQIRCDYLGRVSLLDFGIGRMASAVKLRSDHQQSWIVLTSDRGQLLGEQGLIGHRSFLAPAIEVPILITPPTAGKQPLYDTGLINTLDVAATICALGQVDPPIGCPGRSLVPVVQGQPFQSALASGGSLSEFGRLLLFETERYKLILDTETQHPLAIYDMLDDAQERSNLLETPAGMDVLDSLRSRLLDVLLPLKNPCR